jgi:DnaJ-class molecular chaperone
MKVILEVATTSNYKVLAEYADSIEDAKSGFDPCDDLQGAEIVGGCAEVTEAYEVVDCPECKGKGRFWVKSEDFPNGYPQSCKKCHGNGYLKKAEARRG